MKRLKKSLKIYIVFSGILIVSCNHYKNYSDIPFEEKEPPPWENLGVYEINCEPPHAHFIPFANLQQARKNDKWQSPMVQSLNGLWKFHLSKNLQERPYWFFKDDYDIRNWKEIKVPANWEMEGYDYPIYVNITYPHAKTPPEIQDYYNPVGSYKQTFIIPENWKEKEIFLHFGAASSMLNVWINEQYVGYSEDSKTPAEFNITNYLKKSKNSIAVEIHRWCDGSYLEDQDFWRTPTDNGLFFQGIPLLEVSAHHNIMEDFESHERTDGRYVNGVRVVNRHTTDVKPRDLTSVNIDFKQMGVGGDNSWGAWTHDEYRLTEREYSYSFRMKIINEDDDPLNLAKVKPWN